MVFFSTLTMNGRARGALPRLTLFVAAGFEARVLRAACVRSRPSDLAAADVANFETTRGCTQIEFVSRDLLDKLAEILPYIPDHDQPTVADGACRS